MRIVCSYGGVSYEFPAEIVAHHAASMYCDEPWAKSYQDEYENILLDDLDLIDHCINHMDHLDIPPEEVSIHKSDVAPSFCECFLNSEDWKVVE